MNNKKINLVYLLGTSYCGSTITGLVLGSDKNVFNAGELKKISEIKSGKIWFDPKSEIQQTCICGKPYKACDFWGKLVKDFDENIELNPSPGFSINNLILLARIFTPLNLFNITKKQSELYSEWIEEVTKRVKHTYPNKITLLDNSKSIYHLILLLDNPHINVKVVYLNRNMRDTVNSFKKHGIGFPYGFLSWVLVTLSINRLLHKSKVKFIKISYKELCNNTAEIFKKINKFLGTNLSVKSYILDIKNEDYHILSGNPLLNAKNLRNKSIKLKIQSGKNYLNQLESWILSFIEFFFSGVKTCV